ncbi:MAG: hypothetical protein ACRD2A_19515 [Vicinamibacterales bacterium]
MSVFFTDRDLGKRFPEILAAAGLKVERHADYFSPATPDEEWLQRVGERGWIAVTHDRRIRYKPNELGRAHPNWRETREVLELFRSGIRLPRSAAVRYLKRSLRYAPIWVAVCRGIAS